MNSPRHTPDAYDKIFQASAEWRRHLQISKCCSIEAALVYIMGNFCVGSEGPLPALRVKCRYRPLADTHAPGLFCVAASLSRPQFHFVSVMSYGMKTMI